MSRGAGLLGMLLVAIAISGCDSPSESRPRLLEIEVDGWVERGGVVTLRLLEDGVPVTAGQNAVAWTFEPAASAELVGLTQARLLATGAVTVTATHRGAAISTSLDVVVPPSIVFDRSEAGNRDLWRVALDGGELTRLTTHASDDLDASVAAGEIVFASYRNGNAELYAMPVAGGDQRRLTTSARAELMPAFSGDGTRVAYTSDASGTSALWLLTLASGAREEMPGRLGIGDIHASPAWRPGSDQIAFVSTAAGGADIVMQAAGGGARQVLAATPSAEVEPAWSPEGDRLAFVSNRDGNAELYLLDVATGTVTRLTNRAGSDAQPAWLPDGRIVYTATEEGADQLRWLDPAAPALTVLIPTGSGSAARAAGIP